MRRNKFYDLIVKVFIETLLVFRFEIEGNGCNRSSDRKENAPDGHALGIPGVHRPSTNLKNSLPQFVSGKFLDPTDVMCAFQWNFMSTKLFKTLRSSGSKFNVQFKQIHSAQS